MEFFYAGNSFGDRPEMERWILISITGYVL